MTTGVLERRPTPSVKEERKRQEKKRERGIRSGGSAGAGAGAGDPDQSPASPIGDIFIEYKRAVQRTHSARARPVPYHVITLTAVAHTSRTTPRRSMPHLPPKCRLDKRQKIVEYIQDAKRDRHCIFVWIVIYMVVAILYCERKVAAESNSPPCQNFLRALRACPCA